MTSTVVVNGRFLTMQMTGVQRYAREVLDHLPDHLDGDVLVAVPPGQLIDARDREAIAAIGETGRWHGPRGHGWEQAQLPRLLRRRGSSVLFSPANWGPIAVHRQVVLIHDLLPQLRPEYFTRQYRMLARALLPLLVRRHVRLAATCDAVRDDISRYYGVASGEISIIPAGVGAPFVTWPVDDLDRRPGRYCLMVGGHDRRKNTGFVLDWWPSVHATTGLELVITTKGTSSVRFAERARDVTGVREVVDPSDAELAGLYAGALCLLWPSVAEGFGLPLLESMAVGTPFLSTDTGAASQLAVEPAQILPLDGDAWAAALRRWHGDGVGSLRQASADKARRFSWSEAAAAAARAIHRIS